MLLVALSIQLGLSILFGHSIFAWALYLCVGLIFCLSEVDVRGLNILIGHSTCLGLVFGLGSVFAWAQYFVWF